MSSNICHSFPVTNTEYEELSNKFSDLCQYASWQLIKKNTRNNHTDEQEDIAQDLKISMIRAGSYYKRQVYIEKCLALCEKYAKDTLIKKVVTELQHLWENKTRHGANKQKYGPHQEWLLDQLVEAIVPENERPSKNDPLEIDNKFTTYCKAIIWNGQKSLGKKITKEKSIRSSQVSLSEFDFLSSEL